MLNRNPLGPQVRIRCLRQAAGLTHEALAVRIAGQGVRVSAAHLSNVELGYQRASERLLLAWAGALGISVSDVWQPEQVVVEENVEGVAA